MFYCTPAMVVPVVLPASPPLPPPHCPSCHRRCCHHHHTTRHVACSLCCHHHHCHWHTAHHVTLGSCMSCHAVVLPTSPPLPAVSPSGGCVLCHAVVLPALLPPPPLPVRCLLCCRQVVAHCAALWCCLRCRHLRTACCVAVGRLHVMLHCGAAHLTTTSCVLPAMSPLSGCMSCRAVVLPASPPPPPPACCLSCCRQVVACRAMLLLRSWL